MHLCPSSFSAPLPLLRSFLFMKIHFCAISRHVSRRLQLGWCQYLFTDIWWRQGGGVGQLMLQLPWWKFPPHPPLGKPKKQQTGKYNMGSFETFWDITLLNYETIHHLESRFGNNSFVLVESGPFTNRANLCAATGGICIIYIFTGRRTFFCLWQPSQP